jgi:hypothetical protein
MPAPLLMPVMVTRLAADLTRRDAALATVSVVMMACAAACQWSARRSACAAGRPAIRRSTGSGSRITPVENGSTWSASQPSNCATAAQVARRGRQALLAGAGVGDAGVDHQRADAAAGQMLAADLHRRGAQSGSA